MRTEISKEKYQDIAPNVISYLSRKEEYFNKFVAITSLNPKDIESVYGKCDFTYKGEFFTKIWSFEFEDELFFIISANRRGTTVESTTTDSNKAEKFATVILDNFLDNEHVQLFLNNKKPSLVTRFKNYIK